jgi:hypothetical protein
MTYKLRRIAMEKCFSSIMAVCQEKRMDTAVKVQDVLTKFGCHIRIRLGVHDSPEGLCSNTGIILLQLCCEEKTVKELEKELQAIPNVKVKYMSLDF